MAGLGHTVWQVEWSLYCRDILAQHWPSAIRHKDVRYVGRNNLQRVDLICGGFPCQDISSAGKGAGLAGDRSGLWAEYRRVLADLRPRWAVIENVASGAHRWVDAVCAELGGLGYQALPVPLSAKDVGAPHLRKRIFIVAHANGVELRQQRERVSGGWQSGIRPQGHTEPLIYGEAGTPANANGEGQPALSGHGEVASGSASARNAANTMRTGPQGPLRSEPAGGRGPAGGTGGEGRAQPQPGIRGVDDGVPSWVDPPPVSPVVSVPHADRLTALGNAVVPQCAEVIGWMIREMEGE